MGCRNPENNLIFKKSLIVIVLILFTLHRKT